MQIFSFLQKQPEPPIHLAIPAWGDEYVETFLTLALPSLLTPGNLQVLQDRPGSVFRIYTLPENEETIRASPAFKRLTSTMEAEIHHTAPMPDLDDDTQRRVWAYQEMTRSYEHSFLRAVEAGAALVSLTADLVAADGLIRTIREALAQGKRALELPAPRGMLPTMGPELLRSYQSPDGAAIHIEPRALVKLWLEHMHPIMHRHYWERDDLPATDFHVSQLYWPVGEHCILAHCFHIHPLMVWPRNADADFSETIDSNLTESVAPKLRQSFLVEDSDTAFATELSAADKFVGKIGIRNDFRRIAELYDRLGTKRNYLTLRKPLRIKGADLPEEQWREAERTANQVISRILRECRAFAKEKSAAGRR